MCSNMQHSCQYYFHSDDAGIQNHVSTSVSFAPWSYACSVREAQLPRESRIPRKKVITGCAQLTTTQFFISIMQWYLQKLELYISMIPEVNQQFPRTNEKMFRFDILTNWLYTHWNTIFRNVLNTYEFQFQVVCVCP